MLKKWKLLSSKMELDNKWYKVRKDTVEIKPGKILDDFFVTVSNNYCLIIAITSDNKVLLVRQYKHGYGDLIIELPAGYIEENEDTLDAVKRELQEETGYTSNSWQKLGYFIKNSTKSEGNNPHVYLAINAEKTADQDFDETEDIEVILKPFSEALQMAKSGELHSMDTVLGLLLAEEKLK